MGRLCLGGEEDNLLVKHHFRSDSMLQRYKL